MSDELSADFFQLIAQGQLAPRYTSGSRIGGHEAVGTSVVLLTTLAAIAAPNMPTGAVSVEALSASAGDTAAGAGARTVRIHGMDVNFDPITDIVTLNGVTPVGAASQFRRVTHAEVLTSGTYGGTNLGNITIRIAGAGATFVTIPASEGECRSSHVCVPRGYTYYLHDIHVAVESAKVVTIRLWARPGADVVAAPFTSPLLLTQLSGLSTSMDFEYKSAPRPFPQMTDIWADGVVATGTAAVSTAFNYVAVKN